MSNPYVTPPTAYAQPGMVGPVGGHSPAVQQIPVFAILLMIHGGITIACGLFYGALAAVMPLFMQSTMQNAPGGPGPQGGQPPIWLFSVIYGVPALAGLVAGGLQAWGGWRAYHFQSRTLAFVGVAAAFGSVLTCYCSLTGIGVGVYGLILLMDSAVVEAFAMGAAGEHRSEILNRFARVFYKPTAAPPSEPPRP